MEWTTFIERIEHSLGGAEAESSPTTVRAVLEASGPWIPKFDLDQMRGLPEEVTSALSTTEEADGALDVEAVADEVTERLDLPRAHVVELIPCVCRVLDGALDDEGRTHFRRNLPPGMVETFERARPHVASRMAGVGHTLADGNPGSQRPISEDRVAEEDSIAASDEPKGDTKLSGAKGISQERRRRTLADGKPGSTRSIADKGSD